MAPVFVMLGVESRWDTTVWGMSQGLWERDSHYEDLSEVVFLLVCLQSATVELLCMHVVFQNVPCSQEKQIPENHRERMHAPLCSWGSWWQGVGSVLHFPALRMEQHLCDHEGSWWVGVPYLASLLCGCSCTHCSLPGTRAVKRNLQLCFSWG